VALSLVTVVVTDSFKLLDPRRKSWIIAMDFIDVWHAAPSLLEVALSEFHAVGLFHILREYANLLWCQEFCRRKQFQRSFDQI